MRLLKTRSFGRWARKEKLPDAMLVTAAHEIRHGLVDADLGGGLIKKRVARAGGGKSGGYRVFAAVDLRERCVFLYGFAKNERESLDDRDLVGLKRLAQEYLGMDGSLVERALTTGIFLEVQGGESQTA